MNNPFFDNKIRAWVCDRCGAFCHDDLGRPIQFGEADVAQLLTLPQEPTRCLICRRDHGPWETTGSGQSPARIELPPAPINNRELPPSDR